MYLDIFVPDLNLVLEYQGQQHYFEIHNLGPQWQHRERDAEKKKICLQNDVHLIEIPYWWDFSRDSLQATIHESNPLLVEKPKDGVAIPKEPPPKNSHSKFCLEQLWTNEDLSNYHLTEKLDGVRVIWNREYFLTKKEKIIRPPSNFIVPNVALDGHLFIGRGKMDELMNVLNSIDSDWSHVQFKVMDLPHNEEDFQTRLEELKGMDFTGNTSLVDWTECHNNEMAMEKLNQIVAFGGEGLYAKKNESGYIRGNTNSFLKIEAFQECDVQFIKTLSNGILCKQ